MSCRSRVFSAILLLILSGTASQAVGQVSGHSFHTTPYGVPTVYQPTPQTSAYSTGFVRLQSDVTQPLLDFQNRQADKERLLLGHSPCATGQPELLLGAQFRASFLAGRTNTAGSFPYMGRFPGDFTGHTVTDARLLQANQAIVGHFSPWVHGYMETLFSDVFTFPDFKQGSFQMRQAYVTVGNESESPWYGYLGKKHVNFGDMGTLSPFTQSMVWHYFAPLAEGIGLGYSADGFTLTGTLLNGSRGIRVVDSEERGHLNNFAVNSHWQVPLGPDGFVSIGGGYLAGTIYDGPVPEHLDATVTGPMNAAWDANAALRLGPWETQLEIAQTTDPWPASGNTVTAYRAETAVDLEWGQLPARLSGSWSEGVQGPDGSEFEFNRQLVIGFRVEPSPHVMLSLEYVRSSGFAPLINLTTVSNRDVAQNSFVFGAVLSI